MYVNVSVTHIKRHFILRRFFEIMLLFFGKILMITTLTEVSFWQVIIIIGNYYFLTLETWKN